MTYFLLERVDWRGTYLIYAGAARFRRGAICALWHSRGRVQSDIAASASEARP
jgi:hypothetical protein